MLTDAGKRAVYDIYDEAGLRAGTELATRYKSPEEVSNIVIIITAAEGRIHEQGEGRSCGSRVCQVQACYQRHQYVLYNNNNL